MTGQLGLKAKNLQKEKNKRLCIAPCVTQAAIPARCIHTTSTVFLKFSPVVWAEPMKKKRRLDPQIAVNREQRKRKKIEKEIKRMSRFARKLKPIDEIVGDIRVRKQADIRRRERTALTFDESEDRAHTQKNWTRFKCSQHAQEMALISQLLHSQQKALSELRLESEELYQQALQLDDSLIPLDIRGPTTTPPIKNYDSPDGEYTDTTKSYE